MRKDNIDALFRYQLPDHNQPVRRYMAMEMGKHVYVKNP